MPRRAATAGRRFPRKRARRATAPAGRRRHVRLEGVGITLQASRAPPAHSTMQCSRPRPTPASPEHARLAASKAPTPQSLSPRFGFDVAQATGEIVGRTLVNIAGEAQGDVHILGLDTGA